MNSLLSGRVGARWTRPLDLALRFLQVFAVLCVVGTGLPAMAASLGSVPRATVDPSRISGDWYATP